MSDLIPIVLLCLLLGMVAGLLLGDKRCKRRLHAQDRKHEKSLLRVNKYWEELIRRNFGQDSPLEGESPKGTLIWPRLSSSRKGSPKTTLEQKQARRRRFLGLD
jgi:hypothetical protein